MSKTIYTFLIVLFCISCSSENPEPNPPATSEALYFPPISGTDWETKSISSLGWKQEAVQPLLDYLELKHSKSFIILVNGRIVIENYFNGHSANTNWYWASAGKTLTSTVTGIAQQENLININNKVSQYIGIGWTSEPLAKENLITCKNLLTMTSGLDDESDDVTPTLFGENLYVFGSGSTEKRNQMVQVNAVTKKIIASNDLSDLYAVMQSFGKVKPEDFNLEGAIYDGKSWYLLNRGNGSSNKNILFTIEGENLTNQFTILSNDYKLPKIKGVHSSFTDAVLVENTIYFLATAEDTVSTYEDGEVLGSIIGSIDLKTMKINFTKKISDTQKFEGLTLYSNSKEKIEFLLCEDKDTDVLQTEIYKLTLDKK